jgi:peptidoglycan/xylan/chitin deacetylase (PgdA/CDA1 family)
MDAPGIDERALIERTHATLTRIIGASPHGFRAPHGKLTEQTLGHLARSATATIQASRMTTGPTGSMLTAAVA